MAKYRLKAACGWVANSETCFGVEEFDTEEEAQEAAFATMCDRMDTYVELVEDGDE